MLRSASMLLLLVALLPAGAGDPMVLLEAPRYVAGEMTADGALLTWEAPSGTPASGPPIGYRVQVQRDGIDSDVAAVPEATLEYLDTQSATSVILVYRVSAIYSSGESLPVVVVLGQHYPSCTALIYSINPIDFILRPECLKP